MFEFASALPSRSADSGGVTYYDWKNKLVRRCPLTASLRRHC
jgi:hypothetical protein